MMCVTRQSQVHIRLITKHVQPQPLDAPAPGLDDLIAAPQIGCEAYENLLYLDKLGVRSCSLFKQIIT